MEFAKQLMCQEEYPYSDKLLPDASCLRL